MEKWFSEVGSSWKVLQRADRAAERETEKPRAKADKTRGGDEVENVRVEVEVEKARAEADAEKVLVEAEAETEKAKAKAEAVKAQI